MSRFSMIGVAGSIRHNHPGGSNPDKTQVSDLPWIKQAGDHRHSGFMELAYRFSAAGASSEASVPRTAEKPQPGSPYPGDSPGSRPPDQGRQGPDQCPGKYSKGGDLFQGSVDQVVPEQGKKSDAGCQGMPVSISRTIPAMEKISAAR